MLWLPECEGQKVRQNIIYASLLLSVNCHNGSDRQQYGDSDHGDSLYKCANWKT